MTIDKQSNLEIKERIKAIQNEMDEVDHKSTRAVRALILNEATSEDLDKLEQYEQRIAELREELTKLEKLCKEE